MNAPALTLLAVHAHPDDEVTGSGGVLARAAAEGIATVVVTCTDGRGGDGPGGVKPGEPGHDPDAVVATRRAELAASCAVLKVSHTETLGYGDSGMMGWPANSAPGAFWTTPVAEAAERLAGIIRRYRPDVIVTYDENGGYGHPDHIQTHRVTMAALALLEEPPAKVYWSTVSESWTRDMMAHMRDMGVEDVEEEVAEAPPAGLPDDQITTWVDTTAFNDQKYDALAAHASQSDSEFFLGLGRERFARLMGTECFVRVRDTTGAPLPETDLFAGLR